MKSTSSIRIHLDVPDEDQSRRSSFDLHTITSMLSSAKNRLDTSSSFDRQRMARLSSVSSSYALFLKQCDMDKSKKAVS
jgi:hypothetical protein